MLWRIYQGNGFQTRYYANDDLLEEGYVGRKDSSLQLGFVQVFITRL